MKSSGRFTKRVVKKVAITPCMYLIKEKNGKTIKVGSSRYCRKRLEQQVNKFPKAKTFEAVYADTYSEARSMEKTRCRREQPPANKVC